MTGKRTNQRIAFWIFRILGLIVVGILFWILGFIIWHGAGVINWKFLTTAPTDGMTGGGIFPAIVGTFCLIAGSMVVAFPLGVMSAIYTTEYAGNGKIVRFIRIMTNNLGSIPSIIFGLFGMALFVNALGFGDSIIAGSFTLGLLALPLVIRTTEEALKAVPDSYRTAASPSEPPNFRRYGAWCCLRPSPTSRRASSSPSDVCRAKRRRYSSRRRPTSCPSCRRASTTR